MGQDLHKAARAAAGESPGRRRALKLIGGALGCAAVGALPAVSGCSGGEVDPSLTSRFPASDVPIGRRVKVRHGDVPVELLRDDSGVTARVMVCTHQYCEMIWLEWERAYHCPCHGAKFDARGSPTFGPVSVPLPTLPARVVGDTVVVGADAASVPASPASRS